MLTIYKASAGSGKTFTLAYEYIRLLLGTDPDNSGRLRLNIDKYTAPAPRTRNRHRAILAITFTNKATGEMKSRIIAELEKLTGIDTGSDYAASLTQAYACTRTELASAAKTALRELLQDYTRFNISTIDSFFQNVLRTFAREVDHQGDYEIELDDEFAVKSGIDMMLRDINDGIATDCRRAVRWINSYVMERIQSGSQFNIFNRSLGLTDKLAAYVKRICGEQFRRHSTAMVPFLSSPEKIDGLRNQIRAHIDENETEIRHRVHELFSALEAEGQKAEVIPAAIRNILTGAADGMKLKDSQFEFDNPAKAKTLKKILSADYTEPKEIYTKTHAIKISRNEVIFPSGSFTELLTSTLQEICRAFVSNDVDRCLLKTTGTLEFIGLAWRYIERFRHENNLILLSDTNELLARIIKGAEAPFIYERIGLFLEHFLIDEFQDTSEMQWHNLRPLVANSIGAGKDNLIIGDVKQAIYRFRNSSSELLHSVVQNIDFPDDHILRGLTPKDNTNYRSAAGIVRFNNRLFAALGRNLRIDSYDTVEQDSPAAKQELPYLIHLENVHVEPTPDTAQETEITPREYILGSMAAQMIRQHNAGYKWRDIAVLVRFRPEALAVVKYLKENHPEIAVASDEALLIKNSEAVRRIVSMMKLVDRSYSNFSTDDTDGAPRYASNGDIAMMISRFDFFTGQGLDPDRALALALGKSDEGLSALRDDIRRIRLLNPANPIALAETIIAQLPLNIRQTENAYIAAFQDELINYCARYNPSLHAFLTWWDSNAEKLAITSAPDTDAVNVMTIHKSKGLQWDCVFIPFANWELNRFDETTWFDGNDLTYISPDARPEIILVSANRNFGRPGSPFARQYLQDINEQIADSLNVAYVAFTRPGRELFVYCDGTKGIAADIIGALDLHGTRTYTEGAETAPEIPTHKKKRGTAEVIKTTSAPYAVYSREDVRELTSIEDSTSLNLTDIGNEEEKEIVDSDITPLSKRVEAARRGNTFHAILSAMETFDDIDRALKPFIGELSDDDIADFRNIIDTARNPSADQRIKEWFSGVADVKAERSIFDSEHRTTHRPDRLMFFPDGRVVVVDYKFTRSAENPSHRTQVARYLHLLGLMGFKNTQGFLWYPLLGRIINITPIR